MVYLIKGAHVPLEVGQAGLADGVAAREADRQPRLELKRVLADRADQEVGPLRCLDRHLGAQAISGAVQVQRCVSASLTAVWKVSATELRG
jgi:hypothetical protein